MFKALPRMGLESNAMILPISLNRKVYLNLKGKSFKVLHTLVMWPGRQQLVPFYVAFWTQHEQNVSSTLQDVSPWNYPQDILITFPDHSILSLIFPGIPGFP